MFTSGMGRHPPETYADLKQRNYTLYVASMGATGDVTAPNYEKYIISDADR
jgi:hypothetical protein